MLRRMAENILVEREEGLLKVYLRRIPAVGSERSFPFREESSSVLADEDSVSSEGRIMLPKLRTGPFLRILPSLLIFSEKVLASVAWIVYIHIVAKQKEIRLSVDGSQNRSVRIYSVMGRWYLSSVSGFLRGLRESE